MRAEQKELQTLYAILNSALRTTALKDSIINSQEQSLKKDNNMGK